MDKMEETIYKQKRILKVICVVILVLVILLIISRNFGTFNMVKLNENKKTIFSISDLTVDDIKYSDTEKDIIKKLGKPKKEDKIKQDVYKYKILHYNGLTLTLKENYNDYMLVKAEIENKKYKTSRDIKVGDSILNVMKKYKVQNERGTYIYGNYSTDALSDSEIKENIYFGVRSAKEVVYINRDAKVDNNKSNIARLNISYKYGKVKKITWSYDFK